MCDHLKQVYIDLDFHFPIGALI